MWKVQHRARRFVIKNLFAEERGSGVHPTPRPLRAVEFILPCVYLLSFRHYVQRAIPSVPHQPLQRDAAISTSGTSLRPDETFHSFRR